jgi:hypothetical protein
VPARKISQGQIIASIGNTDRLTDRQYSALVEKWNGRMDRQKRAISDECARKGHDRRIAPFSREGQITMVCTNCLSYTVED